MSWVVLRRQGCMWAVPGDEVRLVEAAGDRCFLHLGKKRLLADEVLCVDEYLDVREAGSVFAWAAPLGCCGAAISRHGPVMIIDPNRPPEFLVDCETKISEDQDEV